MRKSKVKPEVKGIQLSKVYPASEENHKKLKQYIDDKYLFQKLNWVRNTNRSK